MQSAAEHNKAQNCKSKETRATQKPWLQKPQNAVDEQRVSNSATLKQNSSYLPLSSSKHDEISQFRYFVDATETDGT